MLPTFRPRESRRTLIYPSKESGCNNRLLRERGDKTLGKEQVAMVAIPSPTSKLVKVAKKYENPYPSNKTALITTEYAQILD